jgi:deoxyuridine 5'-triphosphate nucleotidohydrolase
MLYSIEDDLKDSVKRGTKFSCGIDLPTGSDSVIEPMKILKINTGMRVVIPEGSFGMLKVRSSWGIKGVILLSSVIDSDYLGEIFLTVTCIGNENLHVKRTDCIAQLIVLPYENVVPRKVAIARIKLLKTDRNEGCLGSTDDLPTKKMRNDLVEEQADVSWSCSQAE